jgi:deazaflavin-dependent oxidoreductase (nitroreductase family)
VNVLFQTMTRLGPGASYRNILMVRGRKTGRLHSTPVDIIQVSEQRWLVAGYGPAGWVRNARAAGEVTLSRGRHSRRFEIEEADAPTAVSRLSPGDIPEHWRTPTIRALGLGQPSLRLANAYGG